MGRRRRAAQGRYQGNVDRVGEEAARAVCLSRARSRAGRTARRRGDHARTLFLSSAVKHACDAHARLVLARLRKTQRPVAKAFTPYGERSVAQRCCKYEVTV